MCSSDLAIQVPGHSGRGSAFSVVVVVTVVVVGGALVTGGRVGAGLLVCCGLLGCRLLFIRGPSRDSSGRREVTVWAVLCDPVAAPISVGAIFRKSEEKSVPELCWGGGGGGRCFLGGGCGLGAAGARSARVRGGPLWSQQKVPLGHGPLAETTEGGAQRESITSGIQTPGHLLLDWDGLGGLVGGGGLQIGRAHV